MRLTKKELAASRERKRTGDHLQPYLTEDKLKAYIEMLEFRQANQVASVEQLYEVTFGRSASSKEVPSLDLRQKLQKLNLKLATVKTTNKMQGDVQSYDILQNERYSRL